MLILKRNEYMHNRFSDIDISKNVNKSMYAFYSHLLLKKMMYLLNHQMLNLLKSQIHLSLKAALILISESLMISTAVSLMSHFKLNTKSNFMTLFENVRNLNILQL